MGGAGAPRGRPREFDVATVLDRAAEVFWRQGYEGASLTDLTAAMGIGRTSLYAAFGTKEQLFRAAVTRYAEVELAPVRAALVEPTAARVARSLLLAHVDAVTRPDRPRGCLTVAGGLTASPADRGVPLFLAACRQTEEAALAARFVRALDEGDLAPGADPWALARYLAVVTEGQAVHAAAGAAPSQLRASAQLALAVFSLVTAPSDPHSR